MDSLSPFEAGTCKVTALISHILCNVSHANVSCTSQASLNNILGQGTQSMIDAEAKEKE